MKLFSKLPQKLVLDTFLPHEATRYMAASARTSR